MTKKFFYYAFAVMTAMCMTACSSDDDDDNGNKGKYEVNLPEAPNAKGALQFKLAQPKAPADVTDADAPVMRTIDITECNEVFIELKQPESNSITYVKGIASLRDGKYNVTGDLVRGTIEYASNASRLTRAGDKKIIVDIDIKFGELTYTYKTENGKSELVEEVTPLTGEQAEDRMSRTWNVTGLTLDLKGDNVKAYETWDAVGGVLDLETTLLDEALKQKVSLTEDEKNELRKKLQTVTITKTGLFSLNYTNKAVDAASWQWTDSSKQSFRITLKDGKMGNKFIQNASLVTMNFKGTECYLKMVTSFEDSAHKKWEAIATLKLKA